MTPAGTPPDLSAMLPALNVITIALLVVLLSAKELVRAVGAPRSTRWLRMMDTVVAPLLGIFCLIAALRLIHLLQSR